MKLNITILFLIFLSFQSVAQEDYIVEDEKEEDSYKIKDQIVFDMSFSLQFGTVTVLGGNPQLGYKLTPRFIVGGGYNYISQTIQSQFGDNINDRLHGPTIYGSLLVYEDYFIRSDYQWLTLQADNGTSTPSEFLLNRWLVGAGYRGLASDRLAISSGIYLDLNSAIIQPLFRTGIEYSFGGWY